MKIAINRDWGGFPWDYNERFTRDNPSLIRIVESGTDLRLRSVKVVEIPDEATDWMIEDYDGMEKVIYVVDGKLGACWK